LYSRQYKDLFAGKLFLTGKGPMIDEKSKTSRFIGIFLLSNFLFCYPVLTLFNIKTIFFGVPVFFFFLFSAWLGLIGLLMICAETSPRIQLSKRLPSKKHTIDS